MVDDRMSTINPHLTKSKDMLEGDYLVHVPVNSKKTKVYRLAKEIQQMYTDKNH